MTTENNRKAYIDAIALGIISLGTLALCVTTLRWMIPHLSGLPKYLQLIITIAAALVIWLVVPSIVFLLHIELRFSKGYFAAKTLVIGGLVGTAVYLLSTHNLYAGVYSQLLFLLIVFVGNLVENWYERRRGRI